jgi:uncharacterized protein
LSCRGLWHRFKHPILCPSGLSRPLCFGISLGRTVGEEPGWRGFALPRLQPLHGPLVGSLILGTLWSFWHLPLNLIPTWSHGSSLGSVILAGLVATVAYTIVFTWVFNNTYGSLLIAILLHTSVDTFIDSLSELFPVGGVLDLPMVWIGLMVGFVLLALVVVALTRSRLGYQHYWQEEGPDRLQLQHENGFPRPHALPAFLSTATTCCGRTHHRHKS